MIKCIYNLKLLHTLYEEKLLDPETFTQDTATARAKFYRGDSYVLNMNYQILSDTLNGKMTVDNYELYFLTPPMGKAGNIKISSNSGRLENGIMISQNALKELGEEKFIKMLRFIDWLWYSDEGQTLCLWGVEGETYTLDSNKNFVLNPDIYFNGINPGAPKQLNVDYGFGGGVFAYGGSKKLRYSKFSEGETQWNNRVDENRVDQVLTPPILADELQKEDLNLIQVPLMDYVNTSALEFISGAAQYVDDVAVIQRVAETVYRSGFVVGGFNLFVVIAFVGEFPFLNFVHRHAADAYRAGFAQNGNRAFEVFRVGAHGDGHRAERAVAPADVHHAGIFGFDVAVGGNHRLHVFDRADEPFHQIDVVAGLVHERAAVKLPSAAPTVALVVIRLRARPEDV